MNIKSQPTELGAVGGEHHDASLLGASVAKVNRMYHSGKRNAIQLRPLGLPNTQLNRSRIPICCDFVSHGVCARGEKCASAHGNMTSHNIHWGAKCELARLGGIRREQRISPRR